jgi:hypothetical protein
MLETIAATPQALRAPQILVKRLPFERFAFTQQPHRSPDDLCSGRPLTGGCVQPGLVCFVE